MTDAVAQRVVAEAHAWLGTPYHACAQLKGVGVDCAGLLIGVYSAVGAVQAFNPGSYPTQWHLHQTEERLLNYVKQYADEVPGPVTGGIVLYKFGRTFSHSAIIVGWPMIIHAAMRHKKVILSDGEQGDEAGRAQLYFQVRGL